MFGNCLNNIKSCQQLYLMMSLGDAVELQQPLNCSFSSANLQQIVSVRAKITEPNQLLPGKSLRSMPARHILDGIKDFKSQAGSNMPLDEVENQKIAELNGKIKKQAQGRKVFHKKNKSQKLIRQQYQKINFKALGERHQTKKDDILSFLQGNIKNILKYPQQIIFISRTAFLNQSKLMNKNQKIAYLEKERKFGSVAYEEKLEQVLMKNNVKGYASKDEPLIFDDEFQSSNLFMAMKSNIPNTYLLALRFDYNTCSFGQWFYFKVTKQQPTYSFNRNSPSSNLYTFVIMNITKKDSMFGHGLKISVCRKGVWKKQGLQISYYKNSLIRNYDIVKCNLNQEESIGDIIPQPYYSLRFTLQILEDEQIYISYNQPYTYTRLGHLLDSISSTYESLHIPKLKMRRTFLAQTVLGNPIQMLTITNKDEEFNSQKRIIFVLGRTHPVQTAGSLVAEGILKEIINILTNKDQQQNESTQLISRLLQNYLLKIIPMVNPDGVILGSSRCNLFGYDLNRSWRNPSFVHHREVVAIQQQIRKYSSRIDMFIDLHAHSKKKNVFAYGNHDNKDPFATRQFPFLLGKLSKQDFLFKECKFAKPGEKGKRNQIFNSNKQGTARVFLGQTLKIHNIFTIENSYCSAEGSVFHYDAQAYQNIGKDILKAISIYFSPNYKKTEENDESEYSQYHLNDSIQTQFTPVKENLISSERGMFPIVEKYKDPSLQRQTIQSYKNLRQQFMNQLRQNQQNVKMGLTVDGDQSDSEQEERLKPRVRKYMKDELMYKTKMNKTDKNSSRADKMLGFLKKNEKSTSKKQKVEALNLTRGVTLENTFKKQIKRPMTTLDNQTDIKSKKQNNEKNIEAKPSHFNPQNKFNRLRTISNLQFQHNEEDGNSLPPTVKQSKYKIFMSRSKRTRFQIQSPTKIEKNPCLSIVQIGIGCNDSNVVLNLNVNCNVKNFNTIQPKSQRKIRPNPSHYMKSGRQLPNDSLKTCTDNNKQEQIREYLRRLGRAKANQTQFKKKDSKLLQFIKMHKY